MYLSQVKECCLGALGCRQLIYCEHTIQKATCQARRWGPSTLQNLQHSASFHCRRLQRILDLSQVGIWGFIWPSIEFIPIASLWVGHRMLSVCRAGWHNQQSREADSPSVCISDDVHIPGDDATGRDTAVGDAGENPIDPVALASKDNNGQHVEAEREGEEGDDLLDPLPASPGGLATADLLEDENPRAEAPGYSTGCRTLLPLCRLKLG